MLNFQGFELSTSEQLLGRVLYCAQKTAQLWGYGFQKIEENHFDSQFYSTAETSTSGKDWQVNTRIVQFSFGDIVNQYENRAYPLGTLGYLFEYLKILFDGTALRYFKASKLYGFFTLFPLILIALISLMSWFVSGLVFEITIDQDQLSQTFGTFIKIFITGLLCLLFIRWPGKKMRLILTIAHWGYARAVALQKDPIIEKRYKTFAECVLREISNSKHDEIIVAGHSFGSSWATVVLGMVLDQDPKILDQRRVSFIRVGSSLLNTALFKNAQFIRNRIEQLARIKDLFWYEYQTKDDVISFYKADLFDVLNIERPTKGSEIVRVRFKHSLENERYRKIKKSFYAIHRQYGLYQDKRMGWDYMIRLFGPISVLKLVENPQAVKRIHPDVNF